MQLKKFTAVILFTLQSSSLLAQEDKRLRMDSKKPLRLEYPSSSWNIDKNIPDRGVIYVRDAATGEVLPFELTEDGPNSGFFTGEATLNFQGRTITPEIFVAPKNLWSEPNGSESVRQMVQEGKLYRKPFFLNPSDSRKVFIRTFDSKAQAYDAYESYMRAMNEKKAQEAALAAQRSAEIEAEKRKLEEVAKKAIADRNALEALAEKLRAEKLRKMAELDQKAKAERKKQAKLLADQAMQLYQKEDFVGAEERFAKVIELDPETNQYYFQYGVSLYKNDKFNESVVALNQAKGGGFSKLERNYFLSLNFLKLKEYDPAQKGFQEVKAANDKTLSPSAAFFLGLIQFQKESYDQAKESFEYVLDNSQDPSMDKQAEAYIEQIANIKRFQALRERRWTLGLNGGLMYDSNILSASEANAPTEKAGWRTLFGLNLQYRMIYQEKRDWMVDFSYSDMYSMNSRFQAESSFQNYDPQMLSIYLPFKTKGVLFKLPYQLSLSAGFESINMNADGSGERETILNSTVFKTNQIFVVTEKFFTGYGFEYRRDLSFLNTGVDENQTANKTSLTWTSILFRDEKRTKSFGFDLGYAGNQALGVNQQYTQSSLALSYNAPAWGQTNSWNARLSQLDSWYPKHTTGRKDTNTSLGLGLRTAFSEKLIGTLFGSYALNSSTYSTYSYNKYLLLYQLSWSTNF